MTTRDLLDRYVGFVRHGEGNASERGWIRRFLAADRGKLLSLGVESPTRELIGFRGVPAEGVGRGLFWSMSLDVACWFAVRHKPRSAGIYVATLKPGEVFCILSAGGEREIIAYPKEFYRIDISISKIRTRARRYVKSQKE